MSETENKTEKVVCGIVMPISSIDGCSENHWSDVLDILNESIDDAGFEGNLVSNSDEVGIIHKRIIQNLYNNQIVVCDVSCKNPNVMFELGIRLAFDKPTIIIKDDKTSYTFDTSAIEHLEYPRDLRFSQIVEFKSNLSDKIKATHKKATTDKNYTTFLKHFGTFHVAKLDSTEVTGDQLILEELHELRKSISLIRNRERQHSSIASKGSSFQELTPKLISGIKEYISDHEIRGKIRIRKQKREIREAMEDVIDARDYFRTRKEYVKYFSEVFDAIYG